MNLEAMHSFTEAVLACDAYASQAIRALVVSGHAESPICEQLCSIQESIEQLTESLNPAVFLKDDSTIDGTRTGVATNVRG